MEGRAVSDFDSDDDRPASIINRASDGSSISSVVQFVRGNKEMLLGVLLCVVIIESATLFFEWRNKTVAADLAIYNAQEARINEEVNKQLLTILNCRR